MNTSKPEKTTSENDAMKRKVRTVIVLVVLAVAYVLLRPVLEKQFGLDLPPLLPEQDAPVAQQDDAEPPTDDRRTDPDEDPVGPSDDSVSSGETTTTNPPVEPDTPIGEPPRLGQLKETGRRVYVSTAGLEYRPTRNEHRVEHVMRHAEDDQSRPVHGVFSGSREEILALIDEAWLLAQRGRPPTVRKEVDRDRTAYTVDMKRKIGFKGGQSGKRSNFPECRSLKLVVEGNEVITAYPVTN